MRVVRFCFYLCHRRPFFTSFRLCSVERGVVGVVELAAIPHSAGAITGVLVWALVIENLIKGFAPANFSRLMPFSAAAGLVNITSAGDNAKTLAAALTRVQDAFLFSGYTFLALAIGTALLYCRDAN